MHEDLRKIRHCIKNAQTSQAISFLLALERSLHKQDYSDALIISAAHINLQRDRIRGIVGTSKFNRTIDELNKRIATLVDLIENAIHFTAPDAATIPPNNLTSPTPEVELIQFIGRQFIVSVKIEEKRFTLIFTTSWWEDRIIINNTLKQKTYNLLTYTPTYDFSVENVSGVFLIKPTFSFFSGLLIRFKLYYNETKILEEAKKA